MEKIKQLHITDSSGVFATFPARYKVLFPQDGYNERFFQTNFLKKENENRWNYHFTLKTLYESVEIMQKKRDLLSEKLLKRLFKKITFPFPSVKNTEELRQEIEGTLLYYLKRRYAKLLLLLDFFKEKQILQEDTEIHFHISGEFESVVLYDFSPYQIRWHFLQNSKIRWKYLFYKFAGNVLLHKVWENVYKFPKVAPKKRKRVLFAMYPYAHHHELLQNLYKKLSAFDESEIYWALLGETKEEALQFIPEKFHPNVFLWKEFKNYDKVSFTETLVKELSRELPVLSRHKQGILFYKLAFDSNYRHFNKILQIISPDVVVHVGAHSVTNKVIDQLTRYYKIPSVYIDYAFITKSSNFLYYPRYTKHIVASEYQKKLWETLGDRSEEIIPVGFAKYEITGKFPEKKEPRYAVGYASSHGLSREKELEDLKTLVEICKRLRLKLILKKHPFDSSEDLEEFSRRYEQVYLIKGTSLSYDFFARIDILFSVGSSIMFDAIHYEVPYAEIVSEAKELTHIDLFELSDTFFLHKIERSKVESFLHSFYNEAKFRKQLLESVKKHKNFWVGNEANSFTESISEVLRKLYRKKQNKNKFV